MTCFFREECVVRQMAHKEGESIAAIGKLVIQPLQAPFVYHYPLLLMSNALPAKLELWTRPWSQHRVTFIQCLTRRKVFIYYSSFSPQQQRHQLTCFSPQCHLAMMGTSYQYSLIWFIASLSHCGPKSLQDQKHIKKERKRRRRKRRW